MERSEFKAFEIWHDYFGLAELVQSGKLRDEKRGDEEESVRVPKEWSKHVQMQVKGGEQEENFQNICIPGEQPEIFSLKGKVKRRVHKLCFPPVPYRRMHCAYCKSIHHLITGPCRRTTCMPKIEKSCLFNL